MITSYISEDGAFGGPVAVAAQQSAALAAQGHRVTLLAGWDGRARPEIHGVRLRLVRALRGSLPLIALVSPGIPLAVLAARRHADVVHVHAGRDLISLTAMLALRGHKATVLQTHGMVMPSSGPLTRLVDATIVRPAFRQAAAVLALTADEQQGLDAVSRGRARVLRIVNGVHVGEPDLDRDASAPVLFLARLHPRKQAPVFVEAARLMLQEGVDVDFEIGGPDEGDRESVEAAIAAAGRGDRIRVIGAVAPTEAAQRLASAAIYVLPSRGEIFPMTVLEALAAGTPVVLSDDCGLAPELAEAGAAVVVPPTAPAVAEAVTRLLRNPESRRALAERGLEVLRERYGSAALGQRLARIYGDAVG